MTSHVPQAAYGTANQARGQRTTTVFDIALRKREFCAEPTRYVPFISRKLPDQVAAPRAVPPVVWWPTECQAPE